MEDVIFSLAGTAVLSAPLAAYIAGWADTKRVMKHFGFSLASMTSGVILLLIADFAEVIKLIERN